MNVGISTSVIQRGRTGIAQYLFALLRGFTKVARNQRFSLFVLEEDRPLFGFLDEQFSVIPVPEKMRSPVANILWHQTELPRLCRQLKIDVLHVPSYRRLLWPKPCARVATIHDLAPFRVAGKYDMARMIYGRVVVKQLARRQEEIIAVSHNTASDIERFFGIPRDRVRVVQNGLEHARFYPRDKAGLAGKFDLNRPFFLYVARLEHPGKNHVRLIEAFERFMQRTRSEWLLVFGGSDWHGAEVIHQRIARSRCRSDIKCLGFVTNSDLPELYSAASVFVYPSLYEGFGLPPLEAMACGCPVICSARGSLGEVAGQAARIINPEDVADIAEALTETATNARVRARLAEAGLLRAREFSWDKAAEQTIAVYQAAYAREKGSAPVQPLLKSTAQCSATPARN